LPVLTTLALTPGRRTATAEFGTEA